MYYKKTKSIRTYIRESFGKIHVGIEISVKEKEEGETGYLKR